MQPATAPQWPITLDDVIGPALGVLCGAGDNRETRLKSEPAIDGGCRSPGPSFFRIRERHL